MTEAQEAIKEMLEQYTQNSAEWIAQFGTMEGFNEWFTAQVPGATK